MEPTRTGMTPKLNVPRRRDATSTALYFDTLPNDAVSSITSRPRKTWPQNLLHCGGVLEEALRYSIVELEITVRDFSQVKPTECDALVLDSDDAELRFRRREDNTVLFVWQRCFATGSRTLMDCCRFLRSLTLQFESENEHDPVSLEALFERCGSSLETLHVSFPIYMRPNFVVHSIQRHCRNLHTLTLEDWYGNGSFLPLFAAIGGNLRRLRFGFSDQQILPAIAKCLPVLEDLEILFGHYEVIPFFASLNRSLRIIRLTSITFGPAPHTYLPVDAFNTLFVNCPDVKLDMKIPLNVLEWESRLRATGNRIRALDIMICTLNLIPSSFFGVFSSFFQLEELSIGSTDDNVMCRFLQIRMPKLRKLCIRGVVIPKPLFYDMLAKKVFTLEEFSSETYCLPGTEEFTRLLSANKALRQVRVLYHTSSMMREIELREHGEKPIAGLIRCLRRTSSLRRVEISSCSLEHNWDMYDGPPLRLIEDACVRFRGRGVTIMSNGIQYS